MLSIRAFKSPACRPLIYGCSLCFALLASACTNDRAKHLQDIYLPPDATVLFDSSAPEKRYTPYPNGRSILGATNDAELPPIFHNLEVQRGLDSAILRARNREMLHFKAHGRTYGFLAKSTLFVLPPYNAPCKKGVLFMGFDRLGGGEKTDVLTLCKVGNSGEWLPVNVTEG